jgi:hypothetical protein
VPSAGFFSLLSWLVISSVDGFSEDWQLVVELTLELEQEMKESFK